MKILNFWVKNFDKHFFRTWTISIASFSQILSSGRELDLTGRPRSSCSWNTGLSQRTISTRKWTDGHELTEFVSAILEFQNPSVEFETEKKFRFWFDDGGTKLRFIFCALMLVRATSALKALDPPSMHLYNIEYLGTNLGSFGAPTSHIWDGSLLSSL